jgi:hypothetical protein
MRGKKKRALGEERPLFSIWFSYQATLAQLANCVFAHGKPHLRWDRG